MAGEIPGLAHHGGQIGGAEIRTPDQVAAPGRAVDTGNEDAQDQVKMREGVADRADVAPGRLGRGGDGRGLDGPFALADEPDATPAENQARFRLIRQHTTTPLAVGEVFNSIWDCKQLIEENHLRWDSLGEYLALAVSLEDLGRKTGSTKTALLAKALVAATGKLLENSKGPSRSTGELDNRGSQFYLALYWAQELAAQTEDAAHRTAPARHPIGDEQGPGGLQRQHQGEELDGAQAIGDHQQAGWRVVGLTHDKTHASNDVYVCDVADAAAVEAILGLTREILFRIHNAAARAAHGISGTNDNGISEFFRYFFGVFNGFCSLAFGHVDSQALHGFFKDGSIFTTFDCIDINTNNLNTVFFQNTGFC